MAGELSKGKTMKTLISILILGLLVLFGQSSSATSVTVKGTVLRVLDGDTIDLRMSDRDIRVRFSGIDAPEKLQEYGANASEQLKRMIEGDQVVVQVSGKDRYGRYIGSVWRGRTNINLIMVERGHAWVYRRYTKSKAMYNAEEAARSRKLGLWHDPNPVPPWKWRELN